MKKFSLRSFEHYIFDFDGVIFDTNSLKEKNIFKAVSLFEPGSAQSFTKFFTQNNGIPREEKIFSKRLKKINQEKIFNAYEKLNKNLLEATPIDGVIDFLQLLHKKNMKVSILSGGSKKEILEILETKKLINIFDKVLAGPLSKEKNILKLELKNSIYFGDSSHDIRVANKFKIPIIFVKEKSQDKNYVKYKNLCFGMINNFKEIIND